MEVYFCPSRTCLSLPNRYQICLYLINGSDYDEAEGIDCQDTVMTKKRKAEPVREKVFQFLVTTLI